MFRFELGRIGGIPIYLDMFFVLVLLLFALPYFTAGSSQAVSAGFVIVVGLLVSILLHELGHAAAGWIFKAQVSHIELTGLGGVANFERSLPNSVIARSIIYLAGPAANLFLWWAFDLLAGLAISGGNRVLAVPLGVLASSNFVLLIFNLLPAYPLDGGHTLDAWIGAIAGSEWATRIVSVLGLICAVGIAYMALPTGFFMLFVAFFIGQANWEALQSVGRWRR